MARLWRSYAAVTTYFEYYGGLYLQRFMVSDRRRTDAFARAIEEVVKPGMRVLDVGTGTGILAMFAAKAGAQTVYAIDRAEVTEVAKRLVEHNGLSDRITVIEGNAAEVTLDAPVDVIISEWLGQMAFEENMLLDVFTARDKNLKKSGKMLPCGVEVFVAPITDAELYHEYGPGFWREPIHGLDFSPLEGVEIRQSRAQLTPIDPSSLLSPGELVVALDLTQATSNDPWVKATLGFEINRDAIMHGFAGWFVAHLSENVSLDTGPNCPQTHWSQTYFPFSPIEVKKGQRLEVRCELSRLDYSPRGIEVCLAAPTETHYFALD